MKLHCALVVFTLVLVACSTASASNLICLTEAEIEATVVARGGTPATPTPTPVPADALGKVVITGVTAGDGAFNVQWRRVLDATHYQTAHSTDYESWTFAWTTSLSMTIWDKVSNGVQHGVFVRAYNPTVGVGPWSDPALVIPRPQVTPTPIPALTPTPTPQPCNRQTAILPEVTTDGNSRYFIGRFRGERKEATFTNPYVSEWTYGFTYRGGEAGMTPRRFMVTSDGQWEMHSEVQGTEQMVATGSLRDDGIMFSTTAGETNVLSSTGKTLFVNNHRVSITADTYRPSERNLSAEGTPGVTFAFCR